MRHTGLLVALAIIVDSSDALNLAPPESNAHVVFPNIYEYRDQLREASEKY